MATGTLCVLNVIVMCGGSSGSRYLGIMCLVIHSATVKKGGEMKELIKVLNRIADQLTRIADVCDGRTITLYEAITAHTRCKNREREDGKKNKRAGASRKV